MTAWGNDDSQILGTLGELCAKTGKGDIGTIEISLVRTDESTVSVHGGTVQNIDTAAGSIEVGVRVFMKDGKPGLASGTVSGPDEIRRLVASAKAVAASAGGLCPERMPTSAEERAVFAAMPKPPSIADLQIFDPREISIAELTAMAQKADEAARSVSGVTDTAQVGASASQATHILMGPGGLSDCFRTSYVGVYSVAIAAFDRNRMENGYEEDGVVFKDDLMDPAEIGRAAGEKAVAKLRTVTLSGGRMPVIFSPAGAQSLLGSFGNAVNGKLVERKGSFLCGKMGDRIFAPGVTITDDPHMPRRGRSRAYDAEGVPTRPLNLVEDGVLKSWILDLASARKLGLQSTGHAQAVFGLHPTPAPRNLYLQSGAEPPAALRARFQKALLVDGIRGGNIDLLKGILSCPVEASLLVNGKNVGAIQNVAISGDLFNQDGTGIFQTLVPGSDLDLKRYNAPTVLVPDMMVSV